MRIQLEATAALAAQLHPHNRANAVDVLDRAAGQRLRRRLLLQRFSRALDFYNQSRLLLQYAAPAAAGVAP